MKELTNIVFSIAAILSPLAAASAFLITYEEYRHHYPDKQSVLRAALRAAVFTLLVFLFLGLFLSVLLPLCL